MFDQCLYTYFASAHFQIQYNPHVYTEGEIDVSKLWVYYFLGGWYKNELTVNVQVCITKALSGELNENPVSTPLENLYSNYYECRKRALTFTYL